jgi:hypothetical protein
MVFWPLSALPGAGMEAAEIFGHCAESALWGTIMKENLLHNRYLSTRPENLNNRPDL